MELDCAKALQGVLRASSFLTAFSIPSPMEQTQGTIYCPAQRQHAVACVSLCLFPPTRAEKEYEDGRDGLSVQATFARLSSVYNDRHT